MADLEHRLRRDLKQLSERAQPGSIRPLRAPAAQGRSRAVRRLTPVAATAAVIGVIAGVFVVGHSVGRQPTSGGGPGRMPAYYVTADEATAVVRVRDSVTGRELASARLPRLNAASVLAISGAADDRTFLIADGSALFLLRVADAGRSARLNRLPITVPDHGIFQTNVALSPDGSTVAMSSQDACVHPAIKRQGSVCYFHYSAIRLVSLTTGATRTWSTRALAQPGMWVSWDGNAHLLFSWASAPSPIPCPAVVLCPVAAGYRLLDVSARGGDLLSARLLPLAAPTVSGAPESAFITPDGRAVIAATISVVGSGQSFTVIMRIVELSARTGRLLGVVREARYHIRLTPPIPALGGPQGCYVFSLGPTGIHALIRCSVSPKDVFGRLDNGRFTPLPGLGDFIPGGAAW